MKKTTKLAVFSACTLLALGGAFFLSIKERNNNLSMRSSAIEDKYIFISGESNRLRDSYSNNYVDTVKTVRGSDIQIEHHGLHYDEENNKYVLASAGYIGNVDAINGIQYVSYGGSNLEDITVKYGWNYGSLEYVLNHPSPYEAHFGEYTPPFVQLYNPTKDPIEFESLLFVFSCLESTPPTDGEVEWVYQEFHDTTATGNIYFETGVTIASAAWNNVYVNLIDAFGDDEYNVSLGNVSNLTFEYVEDDEETQILEGKHRMNVAFKYKGFDYNFTIHVIGYDHYSMQLSQYATMYPREFLIQNNDVAPEDIEVNISAIINVFDSHDSRLDDGDLRISNYIIIEYSDLDIVNAEEHPFSVCGEHTLSFRYQEVIYSAGYEVYDPVNYNIRYVSFRDSSIRDRLGRVDKGTTAEEYLDSIGEVPVYVSYYTNPGGELPTEVNLTKNNFDVSSVDFSTAGVYLGTYTYSTYSGQFTIEVVESISGNPIKVYESVVDHEVSIFTMSGPMTLNNIELYENNVYKVNFKGGSTATISGVYSTEPNNILILRGQLGAVRVVVTDVDENGGTYVGFDYNTLTVLKTLMVDFSALGAPSGYIYSMVLYTNGEYAIDMGMGANCPMRDTYELDGNVITFNFTAYGTLVGDIDANNNMLVRS